MTRLINWEGRLNAYIAEPATVQFAWGTNDCALFACGAVMAMTGEHPAPEFVGAYDSRRGAAEALRELGKGTLVETFDAHFTRVAPAFARRGDLVFSHMAVGVCMGAYALFLQENSDQFARFHRAEWEIAWRID